MRIFSTAAIALLLVAATVSAQAPAGTPFAPERIVVSAGSGGEIVADRGLVPVRLVRSDPASRMIHVEVYRFRRQPGADPATPPIFLLNGGPGWPGVGNTVNDTTAMKRMVLPFIRFTDLVLIGQRGIGSSPPNTVCDAAAPIPQSEEPTPERRARGMRDAAKACREKWEAQGYDLRGFNVIEAAGDVNDARRALGYEKITIFGTSFGSHWGMAVLRFHPDIVARAVMSGLEGPDHTYDSPGGVLQALERIAAAAEQDPKFAGMIPDGGIVSALRALIRELDASPVEHPIPGSQMRARITGDALRDVMLGYTGSTSSRTGIRSWPSDMLRLIRRDWSGIAPRIAMGARVLGPLPTASFFMLDCGSGITPGRHARYGADPAQEIVGDPGEFYDLICPVWEADIGNEFRQYFRTGIPTLLVHGTWDTSTPYANALELVPHFENSRFVTVEGGSHGALNEAITAFPDFAATVWRFAETGSFDGIPERVVLPALEWVVPPAKTGTGPIDGPAPNAALLQRR
ncbi:MAG: alpha/beta hydrolase [Gemmatimonadetes bacterium]|nr:alpha/beta hydrolase [Gemmatimonadota bacterium]